MALRDTLTSRRYIAVVIAAVAGVCVMLMTRTPAARYRVATGSVWTTDYHITYEASRDLADSVTAVLRRVDASASAFNAQSLISAINAGRTDSVDDLIARLYRGAAIVNEASGGLYDPTVMPLVDAWGFGRKEASTPSQAAIDSALTLVGMHRTRLVDGRLLRDDKRTAFDFSSIAKGLACDEVARMLARNGCANYLVEIGGEIVARGVNDRGLPWHVAIDMPSDDDSYALTVETDSCGVATSGNYRRHHGDAAHIVNPLTGRALPTDVLSATIIAPSCMMADAWATACVAMGNARSQAILEHNDTLGVMLITKDEADRYIIWSNPRFAKFVSGK